MRILAVSDQVVERVYSLASNGHFKGVDVIVGCGDLPYVYLEYLVTILGASMFYVPGNHDPEFDPGDFRSRAEGGSNLDLKTAACNGCLIGGFGGSMRYRPDGINQYTQTEAYLRALRMLPSLLMNRIRYRRALDVLISHSPPFGIHDDTDNPHRGLKALNWLHRIAAPRLHLHGHTHFYRSNLAPNETQSGVTRVVNVYPYKIVDL